MAHRLGITTFKERKRYGLSLAIGGAEVKPIDLTSAFSVFANDGKRSEPYSVSETIDADGKRDLKKNESEQVIGVQVARKINSILSDNSARAPIFGPNSPLFIPNKSVAAKTGTTQEFRDAWTIGYTPDIAVGVWCGNNDGHPMVFGSDGVFIAAPIWRKFIDSLPQKYFNNSFIAYEPAVSKFSVAFSGDKKNLEKDKIDKKDSKKKKRKSES